MAKRLLALAVIAVLLMMTACSGKVITEQSESTKDIPYSSDSSDRENSDTTGNASSDGDNDGETETPPVESLPTDTTSGESPTDPVSSSESNPETSKPAETQKPETSKPVETSKPTETDSQQTQPPAHQHSYSASVTQPTCTAQGFTTYTCSCGNSYRADTTAALGHSAGDWITTVAAKVGVAGQRERRCTRCGTVIQTEAIPALRNPNSVTPEESARIIREVKAYAESFKAKGFTFEWLDSMEFGWDVGYMGTPRIRYEGVDGIISRLKTHVDKIVETTTDPANGIPSDSMSYKVVQVTLDNGDIAFVVLYGG